MIRTSNAFLTLAFIALALPLAGCESVDSMMLGVRDRISSIKMPSISGKDETTLQEEQAPREDVTTAAFTPEMTEGRLDQPLAAQSAITTVTEGENCPPVTIVEDLAALHQFENPDRPTPGTRISSVILKDLRTACTANENNMIVELNLTFEGKLGPRARVAASDEPSFAYPYFVAITTTDGNIVAKEIFASTITYRPEDETTLDYETMRQIISLGGEYDTDYEILIGFQLTEGELAYNRALSEGPAVSAYVPEHYIESAAPAEPATATPVTVIPESKPPVPQTAKAAAAPAPVPEAAAVPAPVAETTEKAVEAATEQAPAPVTPVAPATTEAPESPAGSIDLTEPAPAAPQAITITDDGEIIAAPEVQEEAIEEEAEDAILEENAIIDAETIEDPVDELRAPNDVPATMDVQ